MLLLPSYNLLVAEVVEALLPEYKTKEVPNRDALDVFIKHRITATQRAQVLLLLYLLLLLLFP